MLGPVLRRQLSPHVALVTLNRPETRNAVDGALARALERTVEDIEADAETWVAILTGAGGVAFCAGADLKEVSEGRMQGLFTERGGFAGFAQAQRAKPWIAAVEGFALAGGMELVLACDLVVASRRAVFGLPEVSRGLVAAAGGVFRLPRAVPRAIAFELIATGARLDAARASELGLVNRLCESGQAVDVAREVAEAIARNAPIAVRESLSLARAAFDRDDATLMRESVAAQLRLSRTEDYAEGPLAFLEKRPPVWRNC